MARPGADGGVGMEDGRMSDITGGPAYPVVGHMYDKSTLGGQLAHGMTLLDHFAGLAMQGYLTNIGIVGGNAPTDADIARYAYQMAEAMLSAREIYMDGGI